MTESARISWVRFIPAWGRWALVAGLVVLLLVVGALNDQLLVALDVFWVKMLSLVGLQRFAAKAPPGVDGEVTRRALPASATYALGYMAGCLLLLRLVVADAAQWRLVPRLYIGVGILTVLLIGVGKLAGVSWLYSLSRHLIDFLVSPLPVIGLLVLFRAGLGFNRRS